MVRARLLELFLGGGHLSSGELPNPPPDRLRAGGESKDEMVRFFPAVRLQDVALEVLQHLAVLGPGGVDVVSRRSTAMDGPEARHVKESFRVNFQLGRRR